MTYHVYGLIDPINKQLRYVGFTVNFEDRLNQHCQSSKLKNNNKKNNWIKSIKKSGLVPEIFSIEQYESEEKALQAEIELISYYRYIGCDLTNVTKGGDKGVSYIRTDAIKQKISKSSMGKQHSQETKNKISKKLTGIKRNHSLEHREKISKSLTGRKPPIKSFETKNKLRLAKLGTKHTEESKIKAVENNKNYKLTKKDIINIKALYQSQKYTYQELSQLFNISTTHTYRIIKGQTGKYLP